MCQKWKTTYLMANVGWGIRFGGCWHKQEVQKLAVNYAERLSRLGEQWWKLFKSVATSGASQCYMQIMRTVLFACSIPKTSSDFATCHQSAPRNVCVGCEFVDWTAVDSSHGEQAPFVNVDWSVQQLPSPLCAWLLVLLTLLWSNFHVCFSSNKTSLK